MAELTLEERVLALEQQMAALRTGEDKKGRNKDWRRTIGMFTGDEGMLELFEEAMKIRQQDRKEARQHSPPRRRTKT